MAFLFGFFLLTQVGDLSSDIKSKLQAYGAQAAFSLRDGNGVELVEVNGIKSMAPASVAKLVSTACSLKELGPTFQFKTTFAYTGQISKGVLTGDLVIRGSGDFSLVIEDLKMILERLRFVAGIQEIKGKLIFDTSYFGAATLQNYEGFDGDDGRSFTADLTPLPLNHNSFAVWLQPIGNELHISQLPQNAVDINLVSDLKLAPGKLFGSSLSIDWQPTKKYFKLSGKWGSGDGEKAIYRAVPNPYDSFARLFKYNFELLGGKWTGTYATQNSVPGAEDIFSYDSRPLSRLLLDVNKLSTNFGAELTLLAAGAKRFGSPASSEKSVKVLKECVAAHGVSPVDISLENASGLSRSSTLKPSALTKFLSSLQQEDFFPEYLSTLSVLGRDGTTRSRLKEFEGRARLKTGSIKNVKSIAGYIMPNKSFAMILNCGTCDPAQWNRIENDVLKIMINAQKR